MDEDEGSIVVVGRKKQKQGRNALYRLKRFVVASLSRSARFLLFVDYSTIGFGEVKSTSRLDLDIRIQKTSLASFVSCHSSSTITSMISGIRDCK